VTRKRSCRSVLARKTRSARQLLTGGGSAERGTSMRVTAAWLLKPVSAAVSMLSSGGSKSVAG
jgi:hypothetical protein